MSHHGLYAFSMTHGVQYNTPMIGNLNGSHRTRLVCYICGTSVFVNLWHHFEHLYSCPTHDVASVEIAEPYASSNPTPPPSYTCQSDGCTTRLSRYNSDTYCISCSRVEASNGNPRFTDLGGPKPQMPAQRKLDS